jgi:hypothetical protein
MCQRADYSPFGQPPEPHPDQLGLFGGQPDVAPAERVKCGFPDCRHYATTTFINGFAIEPRCDTHAGPAAQAAAIARGFRIGGRA